MTLHAKPVESATHVHLFLGAHVKDCEVDRRASRVTALAGDIVGNKHFLAQLGIEILLHLDVVNVLSPTHEVVYSALWTISVINLEAVALSLELVAHGLQCLSGTASEQCGGFLISVDARAHEVVGAMIANLEDSIGHHVGDVDKVAIVVGAHIGIPRLGGKLSLGACHLFAEGGTVVQLRVANACHHARGVDIALPVSTHYHTALAIHPTAGKDSVGPGRINLGEQQCGSPATCCVSRGVRALTSQFFLILLGLIGEQVLVIVEERTLAHVVLLGSHANQVGSGETGGHEFPNLRGLGLVDVHAKGTAQLPEQCFIAPYGIATGYRCSNRILALLLSPLVACLVVGKLWTVETGRCWQALDDIGHLIDGEIRFILLRLRSGDTSKQQQGCQNPFIRVFHKDLY